MLRSSLLSCLVLILFVRFLSASPAYGAHQQHDQLSAERVRQMKAEEVMKYMNTYENACENFVEFATGNYGNYFKEKVQKLTNYNPWYHIAQEQESKIVKELNGTDITATETGRKVKSFLKSCENRSKSPRSYRGQLKKLVQEFGQMPVLEGHSWRERDFDWASVVAKINYKTDYGIILHAKVMPGYTDNSINRATLRQPNFILPSEVYYLSEQFGMVRENLEKDIYTKLVTYLGVDEQRAHEAAREIKDFEVALAHGMQNLDTTKPNELYNVTSIDDLQDKYLAAWDTKEYFSTALGLYPTMVMAQNTYLQTAFDVIQRSPKRIVANYIFYIYLNQYMNYLSEVTPCLALARQSFNEYLENFIYQKYYTEDDKTYLNFLWQELKSAFDDSLSSNKIDWIYEEATRQAARDKLRAMRFKFATYEDINFEHKYAKMSLNDYDIIENVRAILFQRGDEGRANILRAPVFAKPPVDMVVYSPEENVVFIPVASLEPNALWSTAFPNAINFGAVGSIIGHEMIHGFDDFGHLFDGKGNFVNWWDDRSARNFAERVECIANQYHNYTFRGVNLPKLDLQAENVSDNAGIRFAYKAYMKWYSRASIANRQKEVLPRISYNHKQLFFIGYAQGLGGAKSENFMYNNDAHFPEEIRVKGVLSNFAEFSKAFQCPVGSVMNPLRKCETYY